MKIDFSENTKDSIILTFANDVAVTIDQYSESNGTKGVIVKAGQGKLINLNDLNGEDKHFFNPMCDYGFMLTRKSK